MAKIVVTEFVSLDGVMEDPGGDSSFRYAGWTRPYANNEFIEFKAAELFAADALLLGRITYEGFARAWPNIKDTGEFGERMNSMPKYVVSHGLKNPKWANSHVISKNIADEIRGLQTKFEKDILINGSGVLIQTLMDLNLIDEYRLLVYPIVLGTGKRLFKDGVMVKLKLIKSQSFKTGVTLLVYNPGN